ncbi:MAG: hypothetical protein ACOYBY_02110 [Dermatophilaceae bacterium]
MGRHESVTRSARPGWLVPAAAVGVVALLGAGGFAVTRLSSQQTSSTTAAATSCSSTSTVAVTTSRAMVAVVQSAADEAARDGACATYAVHEQAEAETATAVASGTHPDVWVPDASVWLDEVRTKAPQTPLVAGPSVASSPLVIALPSRLAAAGTRPSWAGAVARTFPMRTPDPATNASARLALFSSYAALGTSDQARIALGGAMIQLSRVAAESDAALLQRAKDAPDAAEAFPVEESVLAAYLKANPGVALTAALPADGTAQFDHPFVTFSDAAPDVATATKALQSALTSGETSRLTEAGLRSGPSDPAPAVSGMPAAAPTYLPPLAAPIAAGLLHSWTSVRTEMKMLAVIDTSGSMKSPAGASTRMALAHQAGLIALSAFPSGSAIGLWQLGYRLGGMAQDWRELVPTRVLTQVVDGRDQKSLLADGFTQAAAMPAGGTGLYDTVLGAYQAAQAGYDPSHVNSVVLLTDGFNDDPYSITLDELVQRLTALRDPSRPIVLITVGIGPDADQAVLKRIADSVGGQSYSAVQPEQIIPVFVEALLSRG